MLGRYCGVHRRIRRSVSTEPVNAGEGSTELQRWTVYQSVTLWLRNRAVKPNSDELCTTMLSFFNRICSLKYFLFDKMNQNASNANKF